LVEPDEPDPDEPEPDDVPLDDPARKSVR